MSKLNYFSLIHKYIPLDSFTYQFYLPHVTLVTNLALEIGRRQGLHADQLQFIEEASMLHDIGIIRVNAQDIGCTGELPYIAHGPEGRAILETEGLPEHALVCDRHTGVGITAQEIIDNDLPLPPRDMVPVSLEERIICYADVWYSKNPDRLWQRYTLEEVHRWFERFGERGKEKIDIFESWRGEFGEEFATFFQNSEN